MQAFLFLAFVFLSLYKEKFLFTPAIPLNCTASRIRQDSCRPMSLGSYRPANLPIRTDSKQSLRPFPFLSRTGNVLQAFLLQSFCILAFLKENIPLPDSNLNSHLSNLYFSLVTRLLNSQACFSPFIISTILFKRSLVTGWVLWRRWERVMLSVAPLLKTSRAR